VAVTIIASGRVEHFALNVFSLDFLTAMSWRLRDHDTGRRSPSYSFQGHWFLNVTCITVTQVLLRDVAGHWNIEFCATRSRCAVDLQQLAGVLVYVLVVCVSSFLCIFRMLKKEIDQKLVDWKMSLETQINSRECRLPVHLLSDQTE